MQKFKLLLDFSNFRGDLFGGITAGIVALPLALAFGSQTEMGAIAGLYGAIALGIFAALFGGTPVQISGPTAPMTVVSAVIISQAIDRAGGSLESAMPMILGIFFLAGILEALLGVLRIGKYIKFIPYPVVSGFMSGIGAIIIISQIFPLVGATAPEGSALGTFMSLGILDDVFNGPASILALATVLAVYLSPKVTKVIPSPLVALILISLVAYFFFNGQVPVINDLTPGGVPTGLPKLHLSFFSAYADTSTLLIIFEYAITLAALGAIDSLLTSIVADNITKTKHNSNQELIGQGIGNSIAALIGGLPGAGATMRTVINANSGAKTNLSGIIAGLLLLAILLGLGALVGHIPNAVLAGILLTVGISIIDYKGFRHLRAMPKADAAVMIVVLLMTVFVGLLEAVAIGMVMSSLLFMKKISDVVEYGASSAPLQSYAAEMPWSDEGEALKEIGNRIYIKHLDGPLFFGFASRFQEMVKALPKTEVFILRMERVPYVDQSGLYAIEDAILDLQKEHVAVLFTGLQGQPEDMLKSINMVPGLIPEEHCFDDFSSCTVWLKEHLGETGTLSGIWQIQAQKTVKP
jgi:SulP family sulfate permease